MPYMTGSEFLTAAVRAFPDVRPVLLTAYRGGNQRACARRLGSAVPLAPSLRTVISRQGPGPAIAFPRRAALVLVGEMHLPLAVWLREIQMEVLASGLDAHPPGVVIHLLQVNCGSGAKGLIQCQR